MAFEEKRKYRSCIFCGGVPNSREHFFGDSFAKQMGFRAHWSASFSGANGLPLKVQGGGSILAVAARLVCKTCNEERLEPSMRCTPLLLQMARGERVTPLYAGEITGLLFYFERLAHLVDIVTSNYEYEFDARYASSTDAQKIKHFRTRPPVYTAADRIDWLNSKITRPELLLAVLPVDAPRHRPTVGYPRAYIGRHLGVLGKIVEVNSNKYVARDAATFEFGKRFMAVIGELAFVLESGLHPGPQVMPAATPTSSHYKLLGSQMATCEWPPEQLVTYGDFFGMFHAPVGLERDYRVLGLMMDRSPDFRAIEEADMLARAGASKTQVPKGTPNSVAKKQRVKAR